jgi:hypothetical protein
VGEKEICAEGPSLSASGGRRSAARTLRAGAEGEPRSGRPSKPKVLQNASRRVAVYDQAPGKEVRIGVRWRGGKLNNVEWYSLMAGHNNVVVLRGLPMPRGSAPCNGRRLGLQKVGGVGWARTRNGGHRQERLRSFGRAPFSRKNMWSTRAGRWLQAEGSHAAGRTTMRLSHQKNVHSLVFLVVGDIGFETTHLTSYSLSPVKNNVFNFTVCLI